MSKEYKINTVQDMIDCTNEGNLDNFLTDLKAVIEAAHGLQQLSYSIASVKQMPKKSAKLESDGFTWIDDGKNKIDIKIKTKNN